MAQSVCCMLCCGYCQVLALGHSISGAVLLYDLSSGGQGCIEQARQILTHQLQQQVNPLAACMHVLAMQATCALIWPVW